jgi:hypothetical protein
MTFFSLILLFFPVVFVSSLSSNISLSLSFKSNFDIETCSNKTSLFNSKSECESSWKEVECSTCNNERALEWIRELAHQYKESLLKQNSSPASHISPSSYALNLIRLRRVLQKLQNRENVTIYILGGSLTIGAHVSEGGAYSYQLARDLNHW